MTFADKLIKLRKKLGWSQEELAERLDVSRQSVSKWESGLSMPELDKMIRLSELFGVTTDYLLKEDITTLEETVPNTRKAEGCCHVLSLTDALKFLEIKKKTAKSTAFATLLCILSPIPLLMLSALSEYPEFCISEDLAGGAGLILLLITVAVAVAIFILNGNKTSEYSYLEEEIFETEACVFETVKERKALYRRHYNKNNIIGVCLCITALIPFFACSIFAENNVLLMISMLSLAFALVGIGVVFFVTVGVIQGSFDRILQEGDYSKNKKRKNSVLSTVSLCYWLLATAVFLTFSFINDSWGYSWVIWPIAGVLYPAVLAITKLFTDKNK